MAVNDSIIGTTNLITGKIFLEETGQGLEGLLVEIHDVDPGAAPGEQIGNSNSSPSPTQLPGAAKYKVGSIVTDNNGKFSLSFSDLEFRIQNANEKRPNLLLMVFAPDDAKTGNEPVMLYKSPSIIQNAGRLESRLIKISREQLIHAGISIPDTDEISDKYINRKEKQLSNEKKISTYKKEKLEIVKEKKKEFIENFKKEVSKKNKAASNAPILVNPEANETVESKYKQVVNTEISSVNDNLSMQTPPTDPNPEHGMPVWFYLSASDKEKLGPFRSDNYYIFTDSQIATNNEVKDIVKKMFSSPDGSLTLTHDNPFLKYLKEKTEDIEQANDYVNDTDTEAESPLTDIVPGNNIETVTAGDIPTYIARLIKDMTSPEAGITLAQSGSGQRPDKDKVQETVNAFLLAKGPAETTASYDFNVLQIAFNHVWQELFDADITALLNRIYQTASDKGIELDGVVQMPILQNAVLEFYDSLPPANVAAQFDISANEWKRFDTDYQNKIEYLANNITNLQEITSYEMQQFVLRLREQGERIIETVRTAEHISMDDTINELRDKLQSNYLFRIFGCDATYSAVNFGLLNTYRQNWEPIAYQAGELCSTITLAPGEKRTFSKKTNINQKRSIKEARKNSTSESSESTSKYSAESEIMKKVNLKAEVNASTEGGFDTFFSEGSASLSTSASAERDSSSTKKEMRDSTTNAAKQYHSEHNVEVDVDQSYSKDYEESGTIENPNQELALTCLFYKLEKTYALSEELYRVMPVVMIAQPVPRPEEITEAWIIEHDWIIKRNLLDKSFLPALQYITTNSMRDDFALKELRKNLTKQRQLIDLLTFEVLTLKEEVNNRYAALEAAIQQRINSENKPWYFLWGYDRNPGDETPIDPEAAKAYEKAAQESHADAIQRSNDATAALLRETSTLQNVTNQYNNALSSFLDKQKMVTRFQLHLKKYILHYMQAIWRMEQPDQRYLRLIDAEIPFLETEDRRYVIRTETSEDIFQPFRTDNTTKHRAWLQGRFKQPVEYKPLVEFADLDRLLGFKGNYMIFPLKQHNALTEFMSAPYVDAAFGAIDPDSLGNVGLQDYAKFITRLHDDDPEKYESLKLSLKKWLELLLADPLRNGDKIVVPTNSLFIEALPSAHTILENFKLFHRAMDVKKVMAEVRDMEMKNILDAARLLNGEMEAAHVDKKIIVVSENEVSTNLDVGE